METAAVPARGRLAPLANFGLIVAIPGAFVLAVWVWIATHNLVVAQLVLVAGFVAIMFIGSVGPGLGSTFGIAITTWVTLAVASAAGLLAVFGDCTTVDVNQSWIPWVAGGATYLVAGCGLALRARWLWGLPAAVVLAIMVGVLLALKIPGTPVDSLCPE